MATPYKGYGKGSRNRVGDRERFRDNFEDINWGGKQARRQEARQRQQRNRHKESE